MRWLQVSNRISSSNDKLYCVYIKFSYYYKAFYENAKMEKF